MQILTTNTWRYANDLESILVARDPNQGVDSILRLGMGV